MLGGMGKAMKQIQKMQADMQKLQEELEHMTVSATAGGGVVEVTVNGHRRVQRITVKPEVVDPEDIETLQDLLQAAVNEALRKAEELAAKELQKITGGLQLPPGLV
ncbi:MAG: YbaB/EbfC family nucleoid-associated protein [Firmicutes bacterium]|jgi:DNA-binding YbaB/EbfC family protein|nr:YbaB/EbfC family nucleoid-associated protein [Bacillota bacterium]HOB34804.1 YbaB/EbfC family nucleoid-associated protein [Bacillota bacterium]HPZ91052.1 YbaB/EbfC family nucleoid-associated protein [Bacillota bacterium]HQE02081.1 YbaB/EbfC family nucleoid-associated protein [Bacillota bacterium]